MAISTSIKRDDNDFSPDKQQACCIILGLQLQRVKLKHVRSLTPALFIKMTEWPFFYSLKWHMNDNYFNLLFSIS